MAQWIKNLPTVWEAWVRSLGWKDPLEKVKVTHSSILARRIPWTMGSQRAGHDWATKRGTKEDKDIHPGWWGGVGD